MKIRRPSHCWGVPRASCRVEKSIAVQNFYKKNCHIAPLRLYNIVRQCTYRVAPSRCCVRIILKFLILETWLGLHSWVLKIPVGRVYQTARVCKLQASHVLCVVARHVLYLEVHVLLKIGYASVPLMLILALEWILFWRGAPAVAASMWCDELGLCKIHFIDYFLEKFLRWGLLSARNLARMALGEGRFDAELPRQIDCEKFELCM